MLWSPFAGTLSLEYFDFQTAFFSSSTIYQKVPEKFKFCILFHGNGSSYTALFELFFLWFLHSQNVHSSTHLFFVLSPPFCFYHFSFIRFGLDTMHFFYYFELVRFVCTERAKSETRALPSTLILGNNTIIIKWLIDFNNNKQSSNWAQRLIGNVQSNETDAHCTLHTNQIIW